MEIEVGKRYRELVRASTFSEWKEPVGTLFIPVTVTKTTVRDEWNHWMTRKDFRECFGVEPDDVNAASGASVCYTVKAKFKLAAKLVAMGVSDAEELVKRASDETIERLVSEAGYLCAAKARFDATIKEARRG